MLDKHDYDQRLTTLEKKVDENTAVTEKLANDTSSLLEMWKDASVVFKWIRKLGAGFIWISQFVIAMGALYGIKAFWDTK